MSKLWGADGGKVISELTYITCAHGAFAVGSTRPRMEAPFPSAFPSSFRACIPRAFSCVTMCSLLRCGYFCSEIRKDFARLLHRVFTVRTFYHVSSLASTSPLHKGYSFSFHKLQSWPKLDGCRTINILLGEGRRREGKGRNHDCICR